MTKEELMRKAIELSKENVENGGGPFGAVIATKEGVIVATGVQRLVILLHMPKLVQYVPQPPNWEHLILADMRYTPPANLVPCAWVLFIGHDWTRCTTVTTKPTPKISVLTIPLFMMNWL